jgi:hypothetical protein
MGHSCVDKDLPAAFGISVPLHPSTFRPSKQVNRQLIKQLELQRNACHANTGQAMFRRMATPVSDMIKNHNRALTS